MGGRWEEERGRGEGEGGKGEGEIPFTVTLTYVFLSVILNVIVASYVGETAISIFCVSCDPAGCLGNDSLIFHGAASCDSLF